MAQHQKSTEIKDKISHIVLIGPPCSAKGYVCHELDKRYSDEIFLISLGRMIVDRRNSDQQFNKDWGNIIDEGKYLPFDIVKNMVMERYEHGIELGHHFFCWDGYARDNKQAMHLAHICGEDTCRNRFFVFDASRKTCSERLKQALREGRRVDRGDNDKLENRLDTYYNERDGIIRGLKFHGIFVRHINADLPLRLVATMVQRHVTSIRP